MDAVRLKANFNYKYNLYFDLLYSKIKEYSIESHNTYNIDEKGFLVRVIKRFKRIFSRRQ
jgi:hypothetical protein